MIDPDVERDAAVAHPDAGSLRVHPRPEALPIPAADLPGPNRFDDPAGVVGVRYTATRLRGCLLETMARFRANPGTETALAAVRGIDGGDIDFPHPDADVLEEWLAKQQVGTVRIKSAGHFIDIERAAVMHHLDKHPDIRAAVEDLDPSARLDTGFLRLGGKLGRPVTQACGTAVRDWIPHALGIGYRSKLSSEEPLWAIWSTTEVEVVCTTLDPADPLHRRSVQEVAAAFEIVLPEAWTD